MKRPLLQVIFVCCTVLALGVGTLWGRTLSSGRGWARDSIVLARSWNERDAAVEECLRLRCDTDRLCVNWRRLRHPFAQIPVPVRVPPRRLHLVLGGGFHLPLSVGSPDLAERIQFVSPSRAWFNFGFAIEEPWARGWAIDRSWFVPPWFAVLSCATLAAVSGRCLQRERRQRLRIAAGQCPACGYDLRGADHARCPECGAVVAAHAI